MSARLNSFKELKPSYYMTSEEWSGLDATGKEACAILALDTIERWQKWKKERKELAAVHEMSVKERKQRTLGEEELLSREIKAGIYDSSLEAILESLHIQTEDMLPFCNVRLFQLIEWAAKRWSMETEEAAYALRKALPFFKPKEKKGGQGA